jgi:putative colanic acid biosynthesis UDP-glucose lipid carrier transferase
MNGNILLKEQSTAQPAAELILLHPQPTPLQLHHGFIESSVEGSYPLKKKWNALIKRTVDVSIALLAITFLLSWLIPLLAIFIKLNSKGPVFFLQLRNKKNGDCFRCIKLRSMIVNSESDEKIAFHDDHRITRVGGFLRKFHLDELPQFFNVLAGEMSVIGPRPYMISENEKYQALIPAYVLRHRVKPGMTGLAQSFGFHGSVTDPERMKERIAIDLHYIHHWNFFMDIKIIGRTINMMFKKIH